MPKRQAGSGGFQPVWLAPFEPLVDPSTGVPYPHVQYDCTTPVRINIPLHCNEVLVQASGESLRYTLTGTNPTATSGYRLVNGNDPISIPVTKTTILTFIEESDGAFLEITYGA